MTQSTLDIYTRFFGLAERPFALSPDARFLYWSKHHRRAFAMLEYGLLTRAPITVLTGEIGAGKSTLLLHLLAQVGPELRIGLMSNAHGHYGRLLEWVLQALNLTPDPGLGAEDSYVRLFGRFQNFLISEYAAGRRVALVFDEAQNLDRDTLEEMRMLTNINSGGNELLQLILVGQPDLRAMIRSPSLRQFAQRVAALVHLPAMDSETVDAYIRHRLSIAGAATRIFSPEASALVADVTGGVPRLVNQLADLALVYAYTSEERTVERSTVQRVLDEGSFFGTQSVECAETDTAAPALQASASLKRQ
jgi:type II secretory pathway predicted ATPase ExeA